MLMSISPLLQQRYHRRARPAGDDRLANLPLLPFGDPLRIGLADQQLSPPFSAISYRVAAPW